MFCRISQLGSLLAVVLLSASSFAAPANRSVLITDAYAKKLVAKTTMAKAGRFGKGWQVQLINGIVPTSKEFIAKVNWGSGPHIAIALPEPRGTVVMYKGPNTPKGAARVHFFSNPMIQAH